MRSNLVRWTVGIIVALAIVALVAWARNEPGVGGRDPDPPSGAPAVVVIGHDDVD